MVLTLRREESMIELRFKFKLTSNIRIWKSRTNKDKSTKTATLPLLPWTHTYDVNSTLSSDEICSLYLFLYLCLHGFGIPVINITYQSHSLRLVALPFFCYDWLTVTFHQFISSCVFDRWNFGLIYKSVNVICVFINATEINICAMNIQFPKGFNFPNIIYK